jgi:hypothetical protein
MTLRILGDLRAMSARTEETETMTAEEKEAWLAIRKEAGLLELVGGRQAQLVEAPTTGPATLAGRPGAIRPRPIALPPRLTPAEITAHASFCAELGDKAIWRDYLPTPTRD